MLYSDSRLRQLNIPEQPRGSIVESVIVERMQRPELFAFGHAFGDSIPVDVSRFVVEAPVGWVVESIARNGDAEATWAPTTTTVGDRQRLVWERSALPAIERASLGAPLYARGEQIAVRLRRAVLADGRVVEGPADVEALSRETARMAKGTAAVTPEIKQIVVDVLGPEWREVGKRERAARLYAWTRDSIRYCAIEIGIGGWVPHEAKQTEHLRYGDCKDKANLLRSLLSAVDVDSHLVTIWSDRWPRPFGLPVIGGNFNHAILQVELDDGPVIVDPTTRTVAFADLPPNDEDRFCLPTTGTGSPLVKTMASSPSTDVRTTSWRYAFDDAHFVGTVHSELRGHFADGLRDALLEAAPQQRGDVVVDHLDAHATLNDMKTGAEAAPAEVTPLVIDAAAKLSRRTDSGEPITIVTALAFLEDSEAVLDDDRPAAPAYLWARDRVVDDVVITLPAGVSVTHLPPPVVVDGPLLSFKLAWRRDDGALHLDHELVHHVTVVEPAQIAALRTALNAYHRALAARVLLDIPAPAPTKAAP